MSNLENLKAEMQCAPKNQQNILKYLKYLGYAEHFDAPSPVARAYAVESLFCRHPKYIYENDLTAGSVRGLLPDFFDVPEALMKKAEKVCDSYGTNGFWNKVDHYAPDFETFLQNGVGGTIEKIQHSLLEHANDADFTKKKVFLQAVEISMRAFGQMIAQYGEAAAQKAETVKVAGQKENLLMVASICRRLAWEKPRSFHEALQLVWFVHLAFLYEGRYAMALGRLDRYLYPFYERDIAAGSLTRERALELVECTLYKIGERRYFGGDDVVNIAIGGVKPDGTGAVNELSYVILEAVKHCNIPGPNLSARIYDGAPDEFLDECLKVIGTGLGYPALMNDEVNIPALLRHGYSLEDCRNYCMVGCIENFIQGKQPPWSDGRYNVPKYLELALNNGRCLLTGGQLGPETGEVDSFDTMDAFMAALEKQMRTGAAEYMAIFRNENERYNPVMYTQPFLSCFCADCIGRGLDINDGGAVYPSVHGAACMGIATVADSLAAIEEVVFIKKLVPLNTLKDALLADYEGFEPIRQELLRAPKYGNNLDAADKYAVWYVLFTHELFSKYRTRDGGAIYTAMASNTSNIPAGKEVAATPDGRRSGEPLSDAASPMHGMDKSGPTSVINSMTKPDYTLVACGTVLNQKFSPDMFTNDAKRAKLLALIKTYFNKGGQEMQINAVSREVLRDAMEHPHKYSDLVVRVSGFSAYYAQLDKSIQLDILERTEQE
jgi:pyruvate formate-lyase/glycerol dehydratase family glycyl radical enzyme